MTTVVVVTTITRLIPAIKAQPEWFSYFQQVSGEWVPASPLADFAYAYGVASDRRWRRREGKKVKMTIIC
jgi:hypothetical protein